MAKKKPELRVKFSTLAAKLLTMEEVQESVQTMIARTKKGRYPPLGKFFKDGEGFLVMLSRMDGGWQAIIWKKEELPDEEADSSILLDAEQAKALKAVLEYMNQGERLHLGDDGDRPGHIWQQAAKLMPLVGIEPVKPKG